MERQLIDILLETILDTVKIFPFLFLAYLLMEYLEHKTLKNSDKIIQKSGKLGPLLGGILGIFPQCGFSAAASNLYAGRLITTGTLLAVFLSTSDEMLPIFLSENIPVSIILQILILKVIIAVIAGFIIDAVLHLTSPTLNSKDSHESLHEICEHEHCHCEEQKNIGLSALKHSLQILLYIFLISLVLNVIIGLTGEDRLATLLTDRPVISQLLSCTVGLIPNCAASVVITQLYLEGILNLSSMMAGLLVGAGVGLLVLFKVNRPMKDNVKILGLLYLTGFIAGLLLELLNIQL
jgi:hypothetical protein